MKIILASGSPRRKELLKHIVPEFEIIVSGADETLEEGLTLQEQAENLAYIKAKSVFDETTGDRIVIGSDTMVYKNEKIYGKPKNEEDAKRIIKELADDGMPHVVITGICILIQKDGKYIEKKAHDETKLYFTNITDKEIEEWISTGKSLDKAGAYAMQEEFSKFVERVEGNVSNVVGLPTHVVYKLIKEYI